MTIIKYIFITLLFINAWQTQASYQGKSVVIQQPLQLNKDTLPKKQSTTVKLNSSKEAGIKMFIPKGYEVQDSISGDLNKDGLIDMALVLRVKNEESFSKKRKIMLLLLKQRDGNLKQVKRNDNIILCAGCGGVFSDPYVETKIEKGKITIDHYGGDATRFSKTDVFQYSRKEKNWLLIEEIWVYTSSTDLEDTEEITKTSKYFGKITFEQYDPKRIKIKS